MRNSSGEQQRDGIINRMPEVDRLSPNQKHEIVRMIRPLIEEDTGLKFKNVVDGVTPGKNDSRHDVYRMSAIGHDGATSSMFVKRFREEPKARYELNAIREVRNRGLGGLKAVGRGIFGVSEHGHVLVTEAIPRLETMNIVDWRGYRRTWNNLFENANEPQLSNLMKDVSKYVGQLHRSGITYHDLVLQNIGRTPAGQFIPFDLEFAKFYNPDDHYNFQFITDKRADIACLTRSLAFNIGVIPEDKDNFRKVVQRDILFPYATATGDMKVLTELDGLTTQAMEYTEQLNQEIAEHRSKISKLVDSIKSGFHNEP